MSLSGPSTWHYLGQGHFEPTFIVVSGDLFCSIIIVCVFLFRVELSANFLKIAFFKKGAFVNFSVLSLTLEKSLF